MKKNNILLINWGTDTARFPLLETKKLNIANIYLASTKKIPENILGIIGESNIVYTNPYNPHELCRDVSSYCQQKKISFDIVTTFFEMNVHQTAFLADYLSCKKRLPLSKAVLTSVDKSLMRLKLEETGIIQPNFFIFKEDQAQKAFSFLKKFKNNSFAVIKPAHSGHSYGARKIKTNITSLELEKVIIEAKNDLLLNYDEWMEFEPKSTLYFLIEEWIPGNVYSFDGIIKNNNQITFIGNAEFEMMKPPFLQQIGHTSPIASLETGAIKKCESYTKEIIKSLGLQYCGFHCELKFFKNQPYLIEISGRLPGGAVLETYQALSEKNIFDQFFSIFSNKQNKIKNNKSYFKSESRKANFVPWKLSKYIKPNFQNIVTKECKLYIKSRKNNEFIYNKKDKMGIWLYDVKVQSKSLSSKKTKKIRDSFFNFDDLLQNLNLTDYIKMIKILLKKSFVITKQAFASKSQTQY